MTPNTLYFGDNLQVLRDNFPDESVDLIYLDPPFNSKRDYNMVFSDSFGEGDTAQIKAFEDTWSFQGAMEDYQSVLTHHERLGILLDALTRSYTGDSTMLGMVGYLATMAARLLELHRVLKPTGSLYLHCDPTASHYLKMVLDGVFGAERFLNEITWKRTYAHGGQHRWGPVHDVLLFYSKAKDYNWNPTMQAYDEAYIEVKYRHSDARGRYRLVVLTAPGVRHGDSGLPWQGYNPTAAGRHWAVPRKLLATILSEDESAALSTQQQLDLLEQHGFIRWPIKRGGARGVPEFRQYLGDGVPIQDVVSDIGPINSQAAERLGYPTQKPLALLERVIEASSNPGDLVLDPFCGCGTAVVAAQKLGRRWCGIDITTLATSTIRKRLLDSFPDDFVTAEAIPIVGFPVDLAGARALALAPGSGRHDFQNWVLSILPGAQPRGGTPSPTGRGRSVAKKGADQGIDGVWLWLDPSGQPQRGIISVKSGQVKSGDVRDLRGTVEREGAAMGLLVTLEPATRPMRDEAATAGVYTMSGSTPASRGGGAASYPKIQVVQVEDLLAGRLPALPVAGRQAGFREAKRIADERSQGELFGEGEV